MSTAEMLSAKQAAGLANVEMQQAASEALFFSSLTEQPNMSPENTRSSTTEVEDIGQISCMSLPGTWTEKNYGELRAGASFKEFHLPNDPDVSFNFYYRGGPTDAQSGEAFRGVLSKPDHQLSAAEIRSLDLVMRNKSESDGFSMLSCQTQTINDKRVLMVEGRYRDQKVDVKAMYIDAGTKPGIVQELYFQSPSASYNKYQSSATAAFKSINWQANAVNPREN